MIESTPSRVILFNPAVTYTKLKELMHERIELKINTLTEQYTLEDHLAQHNAIYLVAISPQGKTVPFTTERQPSCSTGWKIISINNTEEMSP